MATDINERLTRLRTRRSGFDRADRVSKDAATSVYAKHLLGEGWEKRAKDQPYTRYCLGAMQEVDQEYTRISVETAERVGNQLRNGLDAIGVLVEFRLQGSVPLNVHIRGVSDVDLLALDTGFLTYATYGRMSLRGEYAPPSNRTSLSILANLRKHAERILADKFPAATVDTSGGKAIAISGGSLARPVDVVPSHWHDTMDYQTSKLERDRAVTIMDKKLEKTLDNLPFLHIHRVNENDLVAAGGVKKAIRLCKHVKNDAIEDGRKMVFPSFDIASTMYHADLSALRVGAVYELAILAETQRFLDELYHDEAKAKSLYTPDGSRKIFDTEEKYQGLRSLSYEIDELAREVAKEQSYLLRQTPDATILDSRKVLRETYVPSL
ncbi:hypothetical protein ELG88_08625 [Rhizobium leguminosarum]|uniref:hypothetical protein n=1 Tax=Rhizobium leguminosarum TaxID=384 RepID=UPI00103099A1|nr:hypothetical protein [Rhizobium leguminosarum]TBF35275.1 hypothetical protein ELG88_08625 [Rhizobium leguminosarum]